MAPLFHLAIPVKDLDKTKSFYVHYLDCVIGRQTDKWCDLNFFGHQLTLHLKIDEVKKISTNKVEKHQIPVRHFGIILSMKDWDNLSEKLQKENFNFIVKPHIRFKGEIGEQATMFFLDPSYNALEFKAFNNKEQIFAS